MQAKGAFAYRSMHDRHRCPRVQKFSRAPFVYPFVYLMFVSIV